MATRLQQFTDWLQELWTGERPFRYDPPAPLPASQESLTVGIRADDGELVRRCLDAGFKPTADDLRTAVSARSCDRAHGFRNYAFRLETAKELRGFIESSPELAEAFATSVGYVNGAVEAGMVGYVNGMETMQAQFFPAVNLPKPKASEPNAPMAPVPQPTQMQTKAKSR